MKVMKQTVGSFVAGKPLSNSCHSHTLDVAVTKSTVQLIWNLALAFYYLEDSDKFASLSRKHCSGWHPKYS